MQETPLRVVECPRETQEQELAWWKMGNKNSRPRVREEIHGKRSGLFRFSQRVLWGKCYSTGRMLLVQGTRTNIK